MSFIFFIKRTTAVLSVQRDSSVVTLPQNDIFFINLTTLFNLVSFSYFLWSGHIPLPYLTFICQYNKL